MSDQTRYRITGAVFLIALAVIVLPMLFDADGLKTGELPELPSAGGRAVAVPEVQPVNDSAFERARALRDSVDEDGFSKDTSTRVGEPVLSDPDEVTPAEAGAAWAVQLASFGDRANAVALRDRLREDGYAALLSETKQGGERITRVAVGPMLDRAEAERLQVALSDRYGLRAIVVGFGS